MLSRIAFAMSSLKPASSINESLAFTYASRLGSSALPHAASTLDRSLKVLRPAPVPVALSRFSWETCWPPSAWPLPLAPVGSICSINICAK